MVKKTTERFLGSNLQYCLHATVLLAVKYLAELTKYVLLVRAICEKYCFEEEKSTLSLVEKRNPSNLELHP
jgi:hypothetical protein